MALVDDCIESFERRKLHLVQTLKPLENGEYEIGRRDAAGDWVSVTEWEIQRLRHEIRETETIIHSLEGRRSREGAMAPEHAAGALRAV